MDTLARVAKLKQYFGKQDPDELERSLAAEEEAQSRRSTAGIGSGIDKIISAIGGTQANPEAYNQMQKYAGEGTDVVKNYLKQKYQKEKDAENMAMDVARAEQQAEQNNLTREGNEEQRKFNQEIATSNLNIKKSEIQRDKEKEARGTADERKASTYVSEMEKADADFSATRASGYRREKDLLAETPDKVKGMIGYLGKANPKMALSDQSERRFINAALRRESGATITPSEKTEAELQYFPRPGDSADTIAQKNRNRIEKIESMRAEAGVLGRAPKSSAGPKMVRVKQKSSGQTGSIPENELTDEYEVIQ